MKPVVDWKALDSYFSYTGDEEENFAAEEILTLSRIHKTIKREPEEVVDLPSEGLAPNGAKKIKTSSSIIVPLTRAPNIQIEEIEQHVHRDNQQAIYALSLGKSGGIINRPPQIDVLAYCNRYKDEMPWFLSTQTFIASAAEHFDYPDVPVLSRSFILDFLRAARPLDGERPCINLDYEPCVGDQRTQCVAHRLSSKPENGGKGFRLRELLFNNNSSSRAGVLDPVPDMCYLCLLWQALKNSTHQRDKKVDKDKVVIINRFMVIIDQPGEYAREKMLISEKVNTGLWGPIPLFNECNYIVHSREQRIEESANLLFRLTRVLLPQTDATPQKASTASNRINATLSTGSRAQ
jgi:hypothetical protein